MSDANENNSFQAKRKMNESTNDLTSGKKAKIPYSKEEIVNNMKNAMSKKEDMECEINKKNEQISESFSSEFDSIERRIKELEKEKAELEAKVTREKHCAKGLIEKKYEEIVLLNEDIAKEFLLVVNEGKELMYPSWLLGEDSLPGDLNTMKDPHWNESDENAEELDALFYGTFAVAKENIHAFRQFLDDNIEIILYAKAIVPMESNKIGNGESPKFERVNDPIRCEAFPNAVMPESVINNLDELLGELRPGKDDIIDLPDSENSWASAEAKIEVCIVRLKSLPY